MLCLCKYELGCQSMSEKRMHRRYMALLFMLLLSVILSGCSDDSRLVKSSLLNAMNSSEGGSITLDLSTVLGTKIHRICLQTPYLTKKYFEQEMNATSQDFYEVSDESFVLWLFIDSKDPLKVQFNRWMELNYSKESGSKCSDSPVVNIISGQLNFDRLLGD